MTKVLFVCVHNAGRSQMAEALFNALAPPGIRAISAGTQPIDVVNPTVVEALREIGIDVHDNRPKRVTSDMAEESDRIVSMGCGIKESCPAFLGMLIDEDWEIEDPVNPSLEAVRSIRELICEKVQDLIARLNSSGT